MKTIRSGIAAGVLVMGMFAALHADSVANKIGLSGIATAGFAGGDRSVMDHTGDVGHDFGGALRIGLTPKMSIGASYDNINLYGKDGERHHPEVILGNVYYHLNPERKLVPTIQLGLGAGSALTDGSFDKFSARAGLGLDYFFSPNFSAGPQVTYTYIESSNSPSDEYNIFGAGLTVNVYFGKPQEKPSAETSTLAPAVIAEPAPAPTPIIAPVMQQPIEQNVSIQLHVLFDSGKSVVKSIYHDDIRRVAEFMDTHRESKAEIEGHSDNTGPADMNKRLSQQRADAVRNYLIKEFHSDASRLTAMGYGEDGAIADNKTREGREKNRRVVATFHAVKLVYPNP